MLRKTRNVYPAERTRAGTPGTRPPPTHQVWLQSPDLRRRTTAGLNKGEVRNALARAVFFNRLGEIRDRSFEQERYRTSPPLGWEHINVTGNHKSTLHSHPGHIFGKLDVYSMRQPRGGPSHLA
ncbi:hypothetical protein RCH23_000149 [Cryobacterium sp. CAN_C3]|nr:hypothetical protein [Cryobacterium sp. CAN_C3]